MFEKLEKGEKKSIGSLEPAAIRLTLELLQESARQSRYFLLSISCACIQGTLESDLLSQSTPCGTKWILVYLLRLYSTSAEIEKSAKKCSNNCIVNHLIYFQMIVRGAVESIIIVTHPILLVVP